ncbi:MAG: hypothetical protein JWN45_389 [Acidobacteriaceae bacterium]|jgi:hypothetical protein|nr:hypothetical protein [Acidobacteriaceae bacterium]
MQAEFSVEIGPDDHCLEIPWASGDGGLRYFDLKKQPELLLEITETHDNRELAEFLAAVNQPNSQLETAKCDTWLTDELDVEDEIFGVPLKFGSYVDLIFSDTAQRLSFEKHEEFARSLAALLRKAPDFAAAAELVLRRCYYHRSDDFDLDKSDSGFYLTLYLYGYGDDEDGAKKNWLIGLKLLQNALLQVTAQARRQG